MSAGRQLAVSVCDLWVTWMMSDFNSANYRIHAICYYNGTFREVLYICVISVVHVFQTVSLCHYASE